VTDRRRNTLILLAVGLLLVGAGIAVATQKTVLGLDLKGGVELVYQGRPSAASPTVTPDAVSRAVEIMRQRVDQLGVSEPEIQTSGRDQISVGLPGVKNVARAEKQVGTPAQLAFYDWEKQLLGPGNKPVIDGLNALDPAATALSRGAGNPSSGQALYPAVAQAAKRPLIDDHNNFRRNPQYWAFAKDKAHTYLAGPDDTRSDLRGDLNASKKPGAESPEIKVVEPGTILLRASYDANAPPANRPDLARWFVLNDDPSLLGKDVRDPKQAFDNGPGGSGNPTVTFSFTDKGAKQFQNVTRTVADRGQVAPGQAEQHFAIALDRDLKSVASVNPQEFAGTGIDGSTGAEIRGSFTIPQAQDLANAIKTGALPIALKLISQSAVSASLGKQALNQGLAAGAAGFLIVVLFLLLFYRVLGLVATLALGIYAVYFFALIKLIPITLTLPGIAGLILTIGVAADANIVIFERVKEEVRAGRGTTAAIAAGYKKGITAIIDANVVTLMTAFILFILATSGVKGFAFTLGIGTLASLFTAVLATQAALGTMGRSKAISSKAALGVSGRDRRITFDFMGASRWFFSASGTILLIGALAVGGKGLTLGIDFDSGTRVQTALVKKTNEDGVRAVLTDQGFGDAKVQKVSNPALGSNAFQLRAKIPPEKLGSVRKALDQKFGIVAGKFSSQSVGPTFGKTVASSALIAIIASLLVISAYIALRFEWKYAVPVLIALMHDLLITAGVYSLTGREVTTSTVAALLTILGFSLYDTIIVFDRVRENVPRMPRAAFSQIVNRSMSEVIVRSLATSFCTALPILALFLFGGETLRDFAFALIVGTLSGAYSSVFIAAPVLTHWKEREHVYRQRRRRIEAENGGVVPAYVTSRGGGAGLDVEPVRADRPRTRITTPQDEMLSRAEFEALKADLDPNDVAAAASPPGARRAPRPAGIATSPRPARKPDGDGGNGGGKPAPDEPENGGVVPRAPKPKKPRNRRHGRPR